MDNTTPLVEKFPVGLDCTDGDNRDQPNYGMASEETPESVDLATEAWIRCVEAAHVSALSAQR
jgi:hypothetical protein